MSENIQPINVEEIMKEIREDIEKRNLRDDLPDFDSIVIGDGKDMLTDSDTLTRLNNEYYLSYYVDYTGNPLKNMFKKVIRKVLKFLILPLVEKQIAFNADVVTYLNELSGKDGGVNEFKNVEAFMNRQESDTEKLESKIMLLEERIAQLEQQLKNN